MMHSLVSLSKSLLVYLLLWFSLLETKAQELLYSLDSLELEQDVTTSAPEFSTLNLLDLFFGFASLLISSESLN